MFEIDIDYLKSLPQVASNPVEPIVRRAFIFVGLFFGGCVLIVGSAICTRVQRYDFWIFVGGVCALGALCFALWSAWHPYTVWGWL